MTFWFSSVEFSLLTNCNGISQRPESHIHNIQDTLALEKIKDIIAWTSEISLGPCAKVSWLIWWWAPAYLSAEDIANVLIFMTDSFFWGGTSLGLPTLQAANTTGVVLSSPKHTFVTTGFSQTGTAIVTLCALRYRLFTFICHQMPCKAAEDRDGQAEYVCG